MYSFPSSSAGASSYSSYLSELAGVRAALDGAYGSSNLPSLYSERPRSFELFGGLDFEPDFVAAAGSKRSAEAAYNPTVLGRHHNIWQNEALCSSNSLIKRPRVEIGSNLPIFPQRYGEKECTYYMQTRTCKFGDACKFDHPIWVPEGGLPGWKESLVPTSEALPERPGELDCPYYMKTQVCKFGLRCKFNHPKKHLSCEVAEGSIAMDNSVLPERPTEPICTFYAKTGKCKFGANCKFNHPKDLQIAINNHDSSKTSQSESVEKALIPVTPALVHNSKGLPIRPGEIDCPFYLKTGSCMYGAKCRYNHPDRTLNTAVPNIASTMAVGVYNPAVNFLPNVNLHSVQATLGVVASLYPQRPGEIACDFYMKTGHCKFGESCKFHHPIDQSAPTAETVKQIPQQTFSKLTLAGLPRREGAVICSFYMKTGTCKFGVNCKFDHPPPREAIAMVTSAQGAGNE